MSDKVLIPGSFNPFHKGHAAIGLYCIQKNYKPIYAISMKNCEKSKPDLGEKEGLYRKSQIGKYGFLSMLLYRPYFTEMASYYGYHWYDSNGQVQTPFAFICIGADTWNRFVDPANYFDNVELRNFTVSSTLEHIKFMIVPRPGYKTLELPDFEARYKVLTDFHQVNISSTEIRNSFMGES